MCVLAKYGNHYSFYACFKKLVHGVKLPGAREEKKGVYIHNDTDVLANKTNIFVYTF